MEAVQLAVIPEFEAQINKLTTGTTGRGKSYEKMTVLTTGGPLEGFLDASALEGGYKPSEGDLIMLRIEVSVAYQNNQCRFVSIRPMKAATRATAAAAGAGAAS